MNFDREYCCAKNNLSSVNSLVYGTVDVAFYSLRT